MTGALGTGPFGLDWVDAVVIVLGLLALARGRRLGAVALILSYCGFAAGLVTGAALAPLVSSRLHSPTAQAVVGLVIVFGVAFVGAGIGRRVGLRAGGVLRRVHVGPLDSLAGMAVAPAATLLACWAAATVLVVGPSATLSSAIRSSRVLSAVSDALPPALPVIDQFRRYAEVTAARGAPLWCLGVPGQAHLPPGDRGPARC